MRALLLTVALVGCVEDLPERHVLIPPPDRGIPIPPPYRPDAFRGWGGGGELDGQVVDALRVDAAPATDALQVDGTELDGQVDAAPATDAAVVDGHVGDAGGADRAISDWRLASHPDNSWLSYVPSCESDQDCSSDEVCHPFAPDYRVCLLPCDQHLICPAQFICCHPRPEYVANGGRAEPFCVPGPIPERGIPGHGGLRMCTASP